MVDYLMITAVIAGVALPIAMKFILGPVSDNLIGQRQSLVSFLAQDRKQNVPNAWFSQENQGETGGKGQLPPVKDLADPNVADPSDIKPVGNIGQPTPKAPPNLKAVGRVNGPGQITVGGGNGPGNASNFGGGGGPGDGSLNDSFFDGSGQKGGTGNGGTNTNGQGNDTYGQGGGRFSSTSAGDEEYSAGEGGAKKGADKAKDSTDKSSTGDSAHRATLEGVKRVEEEQSRKAKAFDWWLLIKILIIALILFLIVLIALGNTRR